mmetsp:Transcript_31702/g.66671  ORF Transcript_31702/g.66671 Transcript_31702/m.66671 type:complete len:821 (-) Transcript_31702:187-2649(-)|eukprot:CAMPEP_0172329126 /NCGR_PEP_ID=MMETSP1058-20130122/60715_1 /TAXON_ID=83371 /ORGANISM="Detonula confervacea, Strain CCMP 353" /LENGTH=820 /DNA_ID=CAMNT_0013046281 /DNA_START=78 /DNA_END=2540 /DNA_ORIENTATION=+
MTESSDPPPTPQTNDLILNIDSIFVGKDFRAESFSQPRWWASGSCYTALVKSGSNISGRPGLDVLANNNVGIRSSNNGSDGASKLNGEAEKSSSAPTRDLVWHDVATNTTQTYVSSDLLIPPGHDTPLSVDDYALSPDKSRLLIFTNSRKVWRKKTRGDYWVLDITARDLRQLGGWNTKPSSLMFATFSPCGNKVAYVMGNNLYVQDVHTFKITALTSDGSSDIINGTFDWVYEEEFRLRKGFRWAPDSKSIAFWQMDQSGVRVVNLINNTDHLYPQLIPIPYPKAGEQNPSCRIGVVAVEGGADSDGNDLESRDRSNDLEDTPSITWIHVPGDPRHHYIASLDWIPGGKELVFQRLNRLQNTVHVVIAEPTTGKIRIAFTDRDDAWIDLQSAAWYGEESSGIRFLEGGDQFLWLSERNGWRQLFLVNTNGACSPLTPPTYDVTAIAGVDEGGGWAYYIASPEDPLRRYLYRTTLQLSKGNNAQSIAPQERITPANMPGTHSYRFSRDGKYAIHVYSTFSTPETTDIVRLPGHQTVAVLADNKDLRDRLLKNNLPKPEFFRIPIEGGRVELDAYIIHPPSLDPKRKYPVLFYVYGEPAMQVVRDMWGGRTSLWHIMLAQQGYVVISIDNRGTPSPRGREWRKCIYRKIGIHAPADQAAATQALLKSRPYLDPKRVAIWGWSGGGSMSLNAIFRHPDLYQTALSIAPVPNQRVYDTIYQERYMGLPSDNVEGYREGSPITHARNLKGNLLIVHGTGDDNCHYAGTETLINELIQHNKQFSMMAYPNRSHSISEGSNTTRHLFSLLTDFLQKNVPNGALSTK